MPAVRPDNVLLLPRVPEPDPGVPERPVRQVVHAPTFLEGAGFPVRRPFPGQQVSLRDTDPFLLLDHLGAIEYGPGEAKGAPWHPHRGFETVTYMIDGTMRHRDSNGGGGLIADGATQWMTAGAGILHDEMPTEDLVRHGGLFHGVQLWVNLPRRLKMTPPRYQSIEGNRVALLTSADGGAVIRLIAGELAGHRGPGVTWTPITYAHVTLSPGARLVLPWRPDFNAMVYALSGRGTAGPAHVAFGEGQLVVFGAGAALSVAADRRQPAPAEALDVLVLGGQPIREPIFHYGPFVMNTHEEIVQAIEDFRAGRMGSIPAVELTPGGGPATS
ncbi:MAG: pirin family protein [Actinomycetia bacterium]|nr:pirin family protein [Actinomycetes bacterium]